MESNNLMRSNGAVRQCNNIDSSSNFCSTNFKGFGLALSPPRATPPPPLPPIGFRSAAAPGKAGRGGNKKAGKVGGGDGTLGKSDIVGTRKAKNIIKFRGSQAHTYVRTYRERSSHTGNAAFLP